MNCKIYLKEIPKFICPIYTLIEKQGDAVKACCICVHSFLNYFPRIFLIVTVHKVANDERVLSKQDK